MKKDWQAGYDYAMESMRHETRAQMRQALRGLSEGARNDFDRGQLTAYEGALGTGRMHPAKDLAHSTVKKVSAGKACAQCKGTGSIPVPTDEPGRFGKATHLVCAHCGGSGKTKKRSHSTVKRIAYRLQLTPSEKRAVDFARGRYSWPDMLAAHATEGGIVAFTEPEMWQWTDDVDSDAEGGHSPFPLASGSFAEKLQRFYDERV